MVLPFSLTFKFKKTKLYVINCLHPRMTCAQSMTGLAQLAWYLEQHRYTSSYLTQGEIYKRIPMSPTPGFTSVTLSVHPRYWTFNPVTKWDGSRWQRAPHNLLFLLCTIIWLSTYRLRKRIKNTGIRGLHWKRDDVICAQTSSWDSSQGLPHGFRSEFRRKNSCRGSGKQV